MQTTYDPSHVPSGGGLRFALVVSEWHKEHSLRMVDEARAVFAANGGAEVDLFWAPGSFEIPVICRALCRSGKYAGVLAFGIVLRGETSHFDMIVNGTTQGLMTLMMETGVPIMNEIIAAEHLHQVLARTQPGDANKGREA